jgi:hypothetical protein
MTTTMGKSQSEQNIGDWITIERLLFGAILVIGAGVRLFGLAEQPLSPQEATNAWAAWLQATGLANESITQATAGPGSALLFSIQTLLFWLAGGGDAWARSASALAGIALVALPWFWRPWLGRTVALSVALLIAIDPWLVAFSRRADGSMLSLLLFAVVLTCLMRLHAPQQSGPLRRIWTILAVAAGLLLTSGALAFSLIPVLAFFVWLYGLPSIDSDADEPADDNGDRRQTIYLSALFVAGVLLGSTAWFSYPQGLAILGAGAGEWIQLLVGNSDYPLAWAFLRFVADQPLVTILGIAGLWVLWRNLGPAIDDGDIGPDGEIGRRQWALFLTLWAVWGIVLLLLPGRSPSSLLVVHGALLLAAGHFLGTLIETYPSGLDRTEAAIVLAVAVALLVSTVFWMRILIVAPDFSSRVAAICLLLVAALILLVAAYSVWGGWRQARWLSGLAITGLLLVANVSSLLLLNQSSDIVADGFFSRMTHPEVRRLATDMATLSAQRIGDPGEIPVQAQRDVSVDPVLAWYLRDMRRLEWVLAPDLDADRIYAPLAVTLGAGQAGAELSEGADSYFGGEYAIRVAWLPTMLFDVPIVVSEPAEQIGAGQRLEETVDAYWAQRAQPLLRWLLFREVKSPTPPESVNLWAPAE